MPRLTGRIRPPSHSTTANSGGLEDASPGLVRLGVSIATLGKFGADVMHRPLDRLGGNPLIGYLFHDDRRPLERACLSGGDSDPLHQERGQLKSVKPAFREGKKDPDGIWGNEQLARRRSKCHRQTLPDVSCGRRHGGCCTRGIWPREERERRDRPYAVLGSAG